MINNVVPISEMLVCVLRAIQNLDSAFDHLKGVDESEMNIEQYGNFQSVFSDIYNTKTQLTRTALKLAQNNSMKLLDLDDKND